MGSEVVLVCMYVCMYVCTGFHIEGAPGIPPGNLEIEYGYYCLSLIFNNNLVPDCVRSNLRISKFKIYLGDMPPDPLVGTHTCTCVSMLSITESLSWCFYKRENI